MIGFGGIIWFFQAIAIPKNMNLILASLFVVGAFGSMCRWWHMIRMVARDAM